jgi:YaiO family outer membrane protein
VLNTVFLGLLILISGGSVWGTPICGPAANSDPPDTTSLARELATTGNRAKALAVLDSLLVKDPSDSDARVLRGIVLSWGGRFGEARTDLEAVLAVHKDYGDAVAALINVEMWSGHPDRAEQLAGAAVERHPDDPALLLAYSKALMALNRSREALKVIRHLRAVDPSNQRAIDREDSLEDSLRKWTASYDHTTEWFGNGQAPWQEEQVQLNRDTPMGSVTARFSHADRFSLGSQQVEIEAYPHIRRGTYAYVDLGYSPDATLYPRYRIGAELYQNVTHGFEVSGGFRQLHFAENINVYTLSVSKYYGNWLLTSRGYFTPALPGTSQSMQFQARRYLKSRTDYWGVRYGLGATPVGVVTISDIQVLRSSSLAAEFTHRLGRRFNWLGRTGYSREDRLNRSGLNHYLMEGAIYFGF